MYMFGDVHHICIARYLQHYVNTQMLGACCFSICKSRYS